MLRFCLVWNRVYVKSNSRIPCWCDAGERYTIIHKDLTRHDFVREIVNSPEMREMRIAVLDRQQNFIQECNTCCCMIRNDRNRHYRHVKETPEDLGPIITNAQKHLAHVEKLGWEYGSILRIEEIQVEPAFPCNLRCPGCPHGILEKPLEHEEPPYLLPLESFQRMIDSIIYNEATVNRISFVGRGEPTLNKEFPAMLDYCRPALPDTELLMDTNANQPYHSSYNQIDWINCSIDGSTAESYVTYRRGGNFDKATAFMREAVADRKKNKICWKYILFNTTDDWDSLSRALQMARDFDVDSLKFVITSIGAHDGKVLPGIKPKAEIEQFLESQTIFNKAEVEYAT